MGGFGTGDIHNQLVWPPSPLMPCFQRLMKINTKNMHMMKAVAILAQQRWEKKLISNPSRTS